MKMSAGDIVCNEFWPEIRNNLAAALNDPHARHVIVPKG